jgi:CheY-like chemotaxis protein
MKKVLLIDDNRLIRAAVMHYLSGLGYDVSCSCTSADVVKAVRQHRPDVILTTLYSEGYGAGRLPCLLRRDARLMKKRAVVLFSDEEDHILSEIHEAGLVNGYFRKTFSLDGLEEVIQASFRDLRNTTDAARG